MHLICLLITFITNDLIINSNNNNNKKIIIIIKINIIIFYRWPGITMNSYSENW